MPKREDIRKVLIIGSGPICHRTGVRVRLFGHAGMQGTAQTGLPDRARKLQSRHDHDGSRDGGCHIH